MFTTSTNVDDLYKVYEGTIISLVQSKNVFYYMIQWNSVTEVDGHYEIVDEPEETIHIMGTEVTKEEWEVLLKDELCVECNQPLEFIDGHVAVDEDTYVCADCVEESKQMLKQMRSGHCAC
jgi:hypothetical protein